MVQYDRRIGPSVFFKKPGRCEITTILSRVIVGTQGRMGEESGGCRRGDTKKGVAM